MLISFLEDFVTALHKICPSWGKSFWIFFTSIGFGLQQFRRLHRYSKIYSWKPCKGGQCTQASLLRMVSFKHFVERLTNAMLSSHNYPQQVSFKTHSQDQKFVDAFKAAVHYVHFYLTCVLDFMNTDHRCRPSFPHSELQSKHETIVQLFCRKLFRCCWF